MICKKSENAQSLTTQCYCSRAVQSVYVQLVHTLERTQRQGKQEAVRVVTVKHAGQGHVPRRLTDQGASALDKSFGPQMIIGTDLISSAKYSSRG